MDFIEENFGAQTSPVELSELVPTPLAPALLPKGAVRNRAATTSLLSGEPDKAIENYQLLMKEGEEGNSAVYDQLKNSILENTNKVDMQGIMSVLSDPKVPYEVKREAVSALKSSMFLKDSGTILHTNSLAAPSKGENAEQESARITIADSIREVYDSRNQIQGLVNAQGAKMDSADYETFFDILTLYVAPGGTTSSALSTQKALGKAEGKERSFLDIAKAILAPGHAKKDVYEKLNAVPPEKRVEITKKFLDAIGNNAGIVFGADNQFAQMQIANEAFSNGGYGSADAWIDTLANVADVFALGWAFRGGKQVASSAKAAGRAEDTVHPATWELVDDKKVPKPAPAIPSGQKLLGFDDQIKRLEANSAIRKENPASPANIVQQSNPEKARAFHEAVAKSQSDEVAEALYGVGKTQSVINDVMPQVVTESGRVVSKVPDIDRNLRTELDIPAELVDNIHDTGALYYTQTEKAKVRSNIVNDFNVATRLEPHDAESSFSVVGGRIKIDAMYGTPEGGFLKAEDAITQAKYALRHLGLKDEDITLMKKEGLDYVPTTLEESIGVEGSYKLRISSFHEITPTDVTNFDKLTTKRNWADSLGSAVWDGKGSVARYMLDAASMVHPVYSGAGVVATDATSRFQKMMLTAASKFTDEYMGLDKARRVKMDEHLREANFNGIKFDPVDLEFGRGFTKEEVGILHSWKKFWDQQYYLENVDIVRTLNAQGYEFFKNGNAELYVKPVPKNQNIGRLYDPATNTMVVHGKGEGDMLYATGGTYAKLRRPATINGDVVEQMIVYNTPQSYTRKLRDSDVVLPYRDGYYQLQYQKNAKFVDEIVRNNNGTQIGIKTIAVAGDTAEATAFAQRMASTSGRSIDDYVVRGDINGLRRGSDEWWDVAAASGRISQRYRGKLLEDANGPNHLGDGGYIHNPMDSAVRAAKSISGRTVTRPMLEAARARFIQQFDAVLPPDGMGGKRFPSSFGEIASKGESTTKELRDARTNYEFIRYLEDAYINSMDEIFKQGFNAIASKAGKESVATTGITSKALSAVERAALRMSESSFTGAAKGAVFTTTIVSNVFRQWIIQPHQVVRTWGYNPVGWATGKVPELIGKYVLNVLETASSLPKAEREFKEFMDASGMLDSVDKSNLVRGTLLDAADTTNKLGRLAGKYVTTPLRSVGFDIGEKANLLGHAASVYERRSRLGVDLTDKANRDAAYSEIRAISGDMNFAGDMPYNQTWMAPAVQFLQVPHKMAMQIANRRIQSGITEGAPLSQQAKEALNLSTNDRLRMNLMDWVMWGSPAVFIADMLGVDILPEKKEYREAFVHGIESAMLNYTLSQITGRDVNLDVTSLSPYDAGGWSKLFTSMMTGGPEQVIINSPSGQLFLKDGGRVQNAIKHMARYFGVVNEIDETPESALMVVTEVSKVFSGLSNLAKAQMILETGKIWDKQGKLISDGAGNTEAIAQLFGFPTSNPRDLYNIITEWRGDEKKFKDAVVKDYKEILRYYTEKLQVDSTDDKWMTQVSSAILRGYGDSPAALKIIQGELSRDLTSNDQQLMKLFLKRAQLPTIGNLRDEVKTMNISDTERANMLGVVDDVEEAMKQVNKKD